MIFLKKPLSVFLACCLFFVLAGCQPKETVTARDLMHKNFRCHMTVSVLGSLFEGNFEKTSDKAMSFTLDKPALLSGLCFDYDDGTVSLQAGGFSFSLEADGLPDEAVTDVVFDLFGGDDTKNSLSFRKDFILLRHEGKHLVSFAEFDPHTLVPQKVYTESGNIEILLSDYELIKEAP